MNVLFGGAALDSGEIMVEGKVARHGSPKEAICNRMCFISVDRQNTGLFLCHTIAHNVMVANLVNVKRFVVDPVEDGRTGDIYEKPLNMKTRDLRTRAARNSPNRR